MVASSIKKTIRVKKFGISDLKINCPKPVDQVDCRIIEAIDKEIITGEIHQELPVKNGEILPMPESDILKIAVVERHKKTGNIGLGFVKNFGIKNGALATTVAHDSHNIIAVGSSDKQIYLAVKKLIEINGGYVVVKNNKVIASLSLPVAGLMTDQPWKKTVYELEKINFAVHRQLKTSLTNPFMTLSFLALPVIPKLKITDKGLFDVDQFKFVDIMIS